MQKLIAFCIALLYFSINAFAQKAPKKDYLITIKTSFGTMQAVLYNSTPKHKENFLKLIDQKFYDSLLFHRVIQNFMIQGGDPSSKKAAQGTPLGSGSNGYKVPAEFSPALFHKKGALAAARDNNPEKASSGCQFYIVQGKKWSSAELDLQMQRSARPITEQQKEIYKTLGGSPHLDGAYTVFGEVISGLHVIDSVAAQKVDTRNRPLSNVPMYISAQKMRSKKIFKKYAYKISL